MRITTIGTLAAVLVTAGLAMNLLAGDSTLTPAVIENLRSEFPSNAQVRAIRNALTNADAKTLVQNRDILATHNDNFSHKVNTKGITNQMNSGRCWMFASFNGVLSASAYEVFFVIGYRGLCLQSLVEDGRCPGRRTSRFQYRWNGHASVSSSGVGHVRHALAFPSPYGTRL